MISRGPFYAAVHAASLRSFGKDKSLRCILEGLKGYAKENACIIIVNILILCNFYLNKRRPRDELKRGNFDTIFMGMNITMKINIYIVYIIILNFPKVFKDSLEF